MRYEEKDITSISSLIDKLDAHRHSGELLWFRGQSSKSWELVPSIARRCKEPVKREWALLKRFKQNATRFIENTQLTSWEIFFLMQHYSVPTRLLDWSESPLISLYFAVDDKKKDKLDGTLWVISPVEMNTNSGFVSGYKNDLPCFDLDEDLDAYLTQKVLSSSAPQKPVAAIASRNSSRMIAQHGVFTLFHSDFMPLEKTTDPNSIWKYKIPNGSKAQIRNELELLGYNKLTLFPEIGNVSEYVREIIK